MLTAIEGLTLMDYTDHDCVVIVILSHGAKNVVCGTDFEEVEVEDVRRQICGVKSLRGKPKLIFVQACQGSKLCTWTMNMD